MLSNDTEMASRLADTSNKRPLSESSHTNFSEDQCKDYLRQNATRLMQIEQELRQISSYGNACDELLNWMSDPRAYNSNYEDMLLKCLVAVYENAEMCGRWSARQILKKASENCGSLSFETQQKIQSFYTDLTKTNNVTILNEKAQPVAPNNLAQSNSPLADYNELVRSILGTNTVVETNTPSQSATSSPIIQQAAPHQSPSAHSQRSAFTSSPSSTTMSYSAPFLPQQSLSPGVQYNLNNQSLQPHTSPPAYGISSPPTHTHQNPQKSIATPYQMSITIPHQQQHQLTATQTSTGQNTVSSTHSSPVINQYNQTFAYQYSANNTNLNQQLNQQLFTPQQQHSQRQIYNGLYTTPAAQNQQNIQYKHQPNQQSVDHFGQSRAYQLRQHENHSHPNTQNQMAQLQMHQKLQYQAFQKQQQAKYAQHQAQQAQHKAQQLQQESQQAQQQQQQAQLQAQMQKAKHHIQAALPQPRQQGDQNFHTQYQARQQAYLQIQKNWQAVQDQQNQKLQQQMSQWLQQTGLQKNNAEPPISSTLPQTETQNSNQENSSTAVQCPSTSNTLPVFLTPGNNTDLIVPENGHIFDKQIQSTFVKKKSDPKDRALYSRQMGTPVNSFNLVHGQKITDKSFFVGHGQFTRIKQSSNHYITDESKAPLIFIFTAWHTKATSQKVDWPDKMSAELNGRLIQLEKRRQIPGRENSFIGKDKPFDLKHLLKEGLNILRIYQNDCACSFEFSIRVYVRESENMITRKMLSNVITKEEGEARVNKLLANQGDDEVIIEQTSIKLSLKCPISLTKIRIPVKGSLCSHIDCFDFHNYLSLNTAVQAPWACPHCNKTCTSENLKHDLFLENLLKTLPSKVAEIEFKDNHSNMVVTKEDDDDSDQDDFDEAFKENAIKKENLTVGNLQRVENTAEVIDLISDDEDTDISLKRPRIS